MGSGKLLCLVWAPPSLGVHLRTGGGEKLCILRSMEVLRMTVGRRRGAPCGGTGHPRAFPAHVGGSFPVASGQADGRTSLCPRCESPGGSGGVLSDLAWLGVGDRLVPTMPGGNAKREAGAVDPFLPAGGARAITSSPLSAASSRPECRCCASVH